MTVDEPVLPELDARGLAAASSLRAEVAAFDLSFDVPTRRPRRGLVAAALLLVVALVATIAWVASQDGDEVRTVDRPPPLLLVPDDVPDGLRFQDVDELGPGPGEGFLLGPVDVRTGPRQEDLLLTWTSELEPGAEVESPTGEAVTIGGRQGSTFVLGDAEGVTFPIGRDRVATILAQGLDGLDLVSLARRSRLEGTRLVPPGDGLPDGVLRRGEVPADRLFAGIILGSGLPSGPGYSMAWTATDLGRAAGVLVQEATPLDELVLGRLDEEVGRVDVGGHRALVSRSVPAGGPTPLSVGWLQSGWLVRVIGLGVEQAELVRMARSLRPVSRAEFERLVAAPLPLAEGSRRVAAGGSGSDRWAVDLDREGSLCVDRTTGGSCSGPNDPGTTSVDSDGDPTIVAGTVDAGSTVDVQLDGRSVLAADPVELDGTGYYVATVPSDVLSVEVIVTGPAGNERRFPIFTTSSGGSSGASTTVSEPGG